MAVGIIAEYNPFHLGHQLHIAETRRALGSDKPVVAVMSGNFVQRGDCAILPKHLRAVAALCGGADLVLELPLSAALSSAEGFARGSVQLLAASGVVDTLSYGSEAGNTGVLRELAEALVSEEFRHALQAELKSGSSFAAARERALAVLIGAEKSNLLAFPNNILGIEYEKALLSYPQIRSITVMRQGAAHDGEVSGGIASASFIREGLRNGEDMGRYMTESSAALYAAAAAKGSAPASLAFAERAILARLRSMSEEDFAPYDEGGEGLYRRFAAEAAQANSIEELLARVKTKRYAHARLRRMLLRIYLGLSEPAEPQYLRVLAANARGCALLHEMKTAATLPIVTKPAEARQFIGEARRAFLLDARATDLYALCCPDLTSLPCGSELTTGPVIH